MKKNLYDIAKLFNKSNRKGLQKYREKIKSLRRKESRQARKQKVCLDMYLVVEE